MNTLFYKDDLSSKATKGLILMTLRQGILQGLLLLKILLVANLLGPEIFGIFGLIWLSIIFAEQLSQVGVEFALIHKQTSVEEYYDTAWTIKIVRGFLLFILIFLSIDFLQDLFHIDGYTTIFLILATTLILEGFVNIGSVEFLKDLNYKKEFIFRALPDIVNVLVTIILAFLLLNIWALVLGILSERIVRITMSYVLHPYRPKISINRNQFKELIQYGRWIFLMGILGFLSLQGADLFIGVILGVIFLAFYQIAYKIATLPLIGIANLISSVSIPTYAKIQNDSHLTFKLFQATLFGQLTLFTAYSSIIFMILPTFTQIVLGNEWINILEISRILLLGALISIISTSVEPLFIANGIQKSLIKWQIARIIFLVVLVIPIAQIYGLTGITWLLVFSVLVAAGGYVFEISRVIEIWNSSILFGIIEILLVGLSNITVLYFVMDMIVIKSFGELILFTLMGLFSFTAIFLFFNYIFKFYFFKELVNLFQKQYISN